MTTTTSLHGPASTDDRGESPKAGSREWWGLAMLALPCLLYSMDLTVLNLAVPHIIADLGPSAEQTLWIMDIYGFVLAGALITMGAIGDRIGRRLLLMLGAAAFGLASFFAAFSSSAELLIAARALLGLAAATLAPSTLSLIRSMFGDERQRSFAIGVWMASFAIGGAIGPLVGGVLLEYFWWGSVFLIAIPVMVMLLTVGPFILPEHRDASGTRIDVISAVMSILTMLALVYGMKHVAVGDLSAMSVASLLLGVGLGWAFARRQQRLVSPMIDIRLLRSSRFLVALLVNLAGFFLAFGTLLILAQHLQLVVGMGPMEAGMWTLFSAIGFVSGSFLAPAMLRFLQSTTIMAFSLVIAAFGFGLLAYALLEQAFPLLVIATFVFSIGLAPVFTLATDLIVGSAPAERAGSAAALAETSSELGGALGIAVLGSIVVGLYRARIGPLLPDELSPDALAGARDSIGAAIEASAALPGEAAIRLVAAAQDSFAGAFMVAAMIGVAMSIIAAAVVMALRNVSGSGH
ncbi:MFS transporter [Billgrantia saliphila]|uniref:MFS transporter n=1 Tax=Billgrantia saliphila TaxID=1848458 RepID=UPI000CE45FDB|nr:MFS transporter [Halomonas saliphila]